MNRLRLNMMSETMKDYLSQLEADAKLAEKMLCECVEKMYVVAPKQIVEAMEYSLMAGGKRIRPVMMMESAKACGLNDIEEIKTFACALEMIHSSSLIHDDLPAMDNDDLRRGKPTNHKVFGEAMAILAGDALLNHANEMTTEYVAQHTECRFAKAAREIAKATGISGMIGGQTIDVLAEKTGLDIASEDMLTKIHSMKTCALLMCAVAVGAYVAGKNEETVQKWREYGLNLGLAFQIIDDVLDVVGDEKILGKPIGSDFENEKPTFVILMGVDGAIQKAREYTAKAKQIAEELENAEFFVWLADYLCKRNM